MTTRQIITINNPRLKQKSQNVTVFDSKIKNIVQDMFETMYHNQGIGLAAIQINIPQRIIVVDVTEDEPQKNLDKKNNDKFVIINPVITNLETLTEIVEEGCLSIPEVKLDIERPAKCSVKFQTIDGEEKNLQCEGILARCLQHEIDHLNGILITDHVSRLKRNRIIKKFQKLNQKKQNS